MMDVKITTREEQFKKELSVVFKKYDAKLEVDKNWKIHRTFRICPYFDGSKEDYYEKS